MLCTSGLVQQGLDLFASMTTKHQIEPKLEHYGSMVDLLRRSGCVKDDHDLIRTMPMNPNAIIWGALLSACRTHDNMELAESVVWNSENYVLLSNVYAERGKWDEIKKVRALMMENRINKALGQSMVG
ncbi:Pentatricopeptide repeat-containing protein [Camellia lanceoleosa]|uniref:Pentatricopeptide repeat-containing protein n=1 Tax=Camellia lanceoleosa TaxID=1840588 RepID=A0ACC0IE55_9ERIC|nr:Pentatricopeptide repeat-containing protein [Camellia lanceoleosa]